MLFFSLADKFFDVSNRLAHPGASCSLNLPLANTGVIVCTDGSLVSVLEVRGARRFIGKIEHTENIEMLTETLEPFFRTGTCDLSVVYETDNANDVVVPALKRIYQPMRAAKIAQGLDSDWLLDEEVELLAKHAHAERCWLVCYTTRKTGRMNPGGEPIPRNLSAADRQSLSGLKAQAQRGATHESFVDLVRGAFGRCGISVAQLTNAEIAHAIRSSIDSRRTGHHWEPILNGYNDQRWYHPSEGGQKKTAAQLLPPRIGYQVWPTEPVVDPKRRDVLRLGNRLLKVMVLRVLPSGETPFNRILRQASEYGIPFRFAGMMHSAGSSLMWLKHSVASLLTMIPIPGDKKTVRDEIARLNDYCKKHREAQSSIQMLFVTWADNLDYKALDMRAERLMQIINSWDQADAYCLSEGVLEGVCSSLPAYRNASVAPMAAGPLSEILYTLPFTRPTMPFNEGGMCFLSEDGRPMPFQPFDYRVMRHHIYLVVGEPGFGKSALMNNIEVALGCSSNELPFLGVLDVGESALASIQMMLSVLPARQRHYVLHKRLRNDVSDAYNLLETDYGLREPLQEHLDEICLMVQLLMGDDNTGAIHPEMPGMIRAVVKLAFRLRSDQDSKGVPACYSAARKQDSLWPVIEAGLERIGMACTTDTPWWEVFDAFHEQGMFREAMLVQRFAMPTLPSLAQAAVRPEIREEYTDKIDGATSLVDYFTRKIGDIIDAYPILSNYTRLDLGEARFVALELGDLVPSGSNLSYAQKKRGAIFFMLSARIHTSRFFWNEERLVGIPEKYHSYHKPYIQQIRRTPNVLVIDEMQRYEGIKEAEALVYKICNEGRKWEIGLMLGTPDVMAVSERIIERTSARFICGFEKKSIEPARKRLKLTDTEVELVSTRIRPPTYRDGAWFLLQYSADEADYSLLLNCKVGSQKLWQLSTRGRDRDVRKRVYQEFGQDRGRRLLAMLYPTGSINDDYERRVRLMTDQEIREELMVLGESKEVHRVMDQIVEFILERGRAIFDDEIKAADAALGVEHA